MSFCLLFPHLIVLLQRKSIINMEKFNASLFIFYESQMEKYRIHHIGYLTGDINNTAKAFELLGYSAGETIADNTQQTFICFLHKDGETTIELVQPYDDNKTMQKLLAKRGVTPYHLCYEVDDVEQEYEDLISKNWTPLFKPIPAPAFDNRKICYFWNSEIGFIELVDTHKE